MQLKPHLQTEADLLQQCQKIAGKTLGQLAQNLQLKLPDNPTSSKGWIGQAIELALGTTAGTLPIPDFHELGIELKTLPLNAQGKPAESTFVTSISFLTIHEETWLTSQCYAKLKKVLWVPIEGDVRVPLQQRHIGSPFLWTPNAMQNIQLQADWEELTFLIKSGRVQEIHGGIGVHIQIRPKAANARSLCYGFDEEGNKIKTLPRGFYLRANFTGSLLAE